ncbi:MAG: helix-turn-helix domain-containing protein [Candidatus Moranbacteria bacterium]|nr:helix-turn-helix domain-containing protein [Candidatus Moranbacteria bacterium]
MYTQLLINAGLTQIQAEALDWLIKNGESKAIDIAKNTTLARGVVYKALEELLGLKLVEKIETKNKVARFRAEHPSKIEEFFDEKERKIKKEKREFIESLPDIVSSYNLGSNKPGVKFLEGEDGIRLALFDTLKSTTEIYTFADVQAVEDLGEINEEYAEKRKKLNIKKKVLVSDTPENRAYFSGYSERHKGTNTEVKFIQKEFYHFKTSMQIYSNKVSYQTLEKENKIAVIIEDKNIFQMHKLFFEYMWETL